MESASRDMSVDIFASAVAEVIDEGSLKERLASGEKLVVKLGVDPTSRDLHLGHAVVLHKLRQFQDAGCQTMLVIGDFTASIGDPSGRNATRPVLSKEDIADNMKTYTEQAALILDKTKTKVINNSDWFGKMKLSDFIGYASEVGLATLLEREDFASRLKSHSPINLHELLYPLTQAIDSVELKADVEIGGWDQKLNLLLGRELQKKVGQKPQDIVVTPALVGLDGERKMSKSYDNYIGLTETADQMYGKLMSIQDSLTDSYAECAAFMSREQISNLPLHPRDRKAEVARQVVSLYHSTTLAQTAATNFQQTFGAGKVAKGLSEDVRLAGDDVTLIDAVKHAAAVSASEAYRLIAQNGVRLDGVVVTDPNLMIDVTAISHRLQVGKHRFFELIKE